LEFKLTFEYLVGLLIPAVEEAEAKRVIKKAVNSAGLSPHYSNYEFADFLKICDELMKEEGTTRIAGLTGITQARCWHTKKMSEQLGK
jgi:hypothetical protein